MFIFGFVWGWANAMVAGAYLAGTCGAWESKDPTNYTGRRKYMWHTVLCAALIFQVFVAIPAAAFLVIMPFFGGWIVTPIVKEVSENTFF